MEGYYRNPDGKECRLLSIAKDAETGEQVAVFNILDHSDSILVCPYDKFMASYSAIKDVPLMCNPEDGYSSRVKAMVTLLTGKHIVPADFFDGLKNDDDIEEKALALIKAFKPGGDTERIFHLIQAWGGSSGRGIYLFGDGFCWNDLRPKYEALVDICIKTKDTENESINILAQTVKDIEKDVKHFGVSFITKHVRFWLYRTLGEETLPIYDSVMAREVMHKSAPSSQQLGDYWRVMVAKADRLGISLMALERQIFLYSLGAR